MFLIILAICLAVAYVVSAPLRRARSGTSAAQPAAPRDVPGRDDLVAAREAKYREIRDAELDFRTGKLSQEDYERLDAELRAEAVEILKRLDELESA